MTDTDFLATVLADSEWHGQAEILERSKRERGHGLTVHSRISDLRTKRGWTIEQRSRRTGSGRVASFYRLVSALESPAVTESDLAGPVSMAAGGSSVGDQISPPSGRSSGSDDHGETPTLQLALDMPVTRHEREAA